MKRLLTALLLLITSPLFADQPVINVYNWANYIPNHVLHQFEQQTGIHVNYLEYDGNETMYAKIKADPHAGFDVIVPSSYYVERMANEGMLQRLDLSQIPNYKYLNPSLLHRSFDPNNNYSLPYMWGTTGMVVNDKFFNPKNFTAWTDFWKKKYKNQLLVLNDMREAFGMALLTLHYSVNETNPEHIRQAYEKLRQLLPNIKLFNSDAVQNIYVDEDATLGMGWSGDIFQVRQENQHVQFVLPQGKFILWIDAIAIPKYAPHLKNAYTFINFINQPNIAAEIAEYNGYSSPNLAAVKLLPTSYRDSPILNLSANTLKRAVMQRGVGDADAIYEKYWQLLKLGG